MEANTTATILLTRPDQPGIVAAMTTMLARNGANIIDLHQHTDRDQGVFFQRIKFDISDLKISRQQLEQLLDIEYPTAGEEWRISYSDRKMRVAVFTSKYDHCLFDLLMRHGIGELDCEIPLVISNHEDLRKRVESMGYAYHCFPIKKETKAEQEQKEIALLKENDIDLVVMARYMQILSDGFIDEFAGRIINIHHSTLPAFIGAKPYHQAFERGVKLIGATAHYATADLDEGPIIAQGVEDATHADTVEDLIRKGRDVERMTLARAVIAHLEDRILVHGRGTVVF
jgi:formyltetrahydrofolate deformylase